MKMGNFVPETMLEATDSDPRLQYSLRTLLLQGDYSPTTRLTCMGVSFEESVSLGQIV
jgi:hypothetical protein